MAQSPTKDAEAEDCAELDEDYFLQIGQTFSVVDDWNENDESEVQIKKEPQDEEANHSKSSSKMGAEKDRPSSRSRNDSTRSRDPRLNRHERTHLSQERSRNSPDRSRTRPSERNRRSPIRQRSPVRRSIDRKPPPVRQPADRRRPPTPQRNRRNSFLMELKATFAKQGRDDEGIEQFLQNGARIDWRNVKAESHDTPMDINAQFAPNDPHFMPQFNPMMGPQVVPPNIPIMSPHAIPNQPGMQFGMESRPPYPMEMFPNPMAQPVINIPQPVPAPVMNFDQQMRHQSSISPPIRTNINHSNGMDMQSVTTDRPPRRKTPNEEASLVNLIDMLRQKSKKSKTTTADATASKKARVLEKCKEAVTLKKDLETNKSKVPLVCVLSKVDVATPMEKVNRSPLLANENNPKYLFQATKEQCHSILEDHPLRNIYGPTAEVAQHLKFDLQDLSMTVARETVLKHINNDMIRPPEAPAFFKKATSSASFGLSISVKDKEVQTETSACMKCTQREMAALSARNKVTQTQSVEKVDAEMQHGEPTTNEDEEGSFRVFIDAQTMMDRNYEQHHALEVFTKAFGISCSYITSNRAVSIERRLSDDHEERMVFANPENPDLMDVDGPKFFSMSPIRRNRDRSPSPPRLRPQIFDRIGEKIESPRRFERDRADFRPYTIPSPQYSPPYRRQRSPGPSRRFRNRSRSISRSPSPRRLRRSPSLSPRRVRSPSPRRFKDGNRFLDRRGRY